MTAPATELFNSSNQLAGNTHTQIQRQIQIHSAMQLKIQIQIHTQLWIRTPMTMFDPVIYACLEPAQLIKLINGLAAQQQQRRRRLQFEMYLRDTHSIAYHRLCLRYLLFCRLGELRPGPTCFVAVCVHNKAISWKIFLLEKEN